MDVFKELDQAYSNYMRLEKSRVKKAQEGSDNPPADPDHLEEEGDVGREPRDGADERAERAAEGRVDDVNKSRVRKADDDEDHDENDGDGDGRREEEDIQKCKKCGRKLAKSAKFCHGCGSKVAKSKGSATRAIRDSQDAYEDDNDGDDLHGEREEVGEEEGKGDDQTQITNMGRRVRKSLREQFYQDTVKTTGLTADVLDANPVLAGVVDTFADYLDAQDRTIVGLRKSVKQLQDRQKRSDNLMEKSARSQAATLTGITRLQRQMDTFAGSPADNPADGVTTDAWAQQTAQLAKSQAANNRAQAKRNKLAKAKVRDALTKGMRSGLIEPTVLSDFDSYTNKGLPVEEWVADALTDQQIQDLGI